MPVKVRINGFGRVGRQVYKAIRDHHSSALEVVAEYRRVQRVDNSDRIIGLFISKNVSERA